MRCLLELHPFPGAHPPRAYGAIILTVHLLIAMSNGEIPCYVENIYAT